MNDNIANRSMPVTIIRSENYDSIGFDLSFLSIKTCLREYFQKIAMEIKFCCGMPYLDT